MKKSAKLFHKKLLLFITIGLVVALSVITGLTVYSYNKQFKKFTNSGYILVPSKEAEITTNVNELRYFSAGTKYREKYGEKILFKDTSNNSVNLNKEQFVHYTDGSLKSFAKGVLMSLTEVDEKQVSYFGISDKTVIVKNATQYEMPYLGETMQIQEFVWKIAEDTYMVVAPQIKLHLSKDKEVTLEDYVQLQYVDGDIVRLVHEKGTYQTISSDAYLLTDGGVMLELISKYFMVNGEQALSLESMIINSDDNLEVEENEDDIKLPTFNVINGQDGADGETGENGETGANGQDGDKGSLGELGAEGNSGDKGGSGGSGLSGQAGIDGSDGGDGAEGDQGDLGYDGKDGEDGDDAESPTSPDGIVAVDQLSAPTVKIVTDEYFVGANSIDAWVEISDPERLINGNLKWTIYTREGYDYVAGYDEEFHPEEGLLSTYPPKQQITTGKLQPDTEYVLIVHGKYTTDYGEYEQDFLTKVFSTDMLGVTLKKVQVTSDKITVKVDISDDSQISSYGIAIYDESDENNAISRKDLAQGNFSTSREFTFSSMENLLNGEEIYPDSNYVVKLVNVESKSANGVIPINVSLDITSLKETPYYLITQDKETIKQSISDQKTNAVPSDRYQTVTLSLDAGIKDPDSGIIGYRYELYYTNNTTAGEGELVASKNLDSLKSVTFDVDPQKSYYGRVVVLFKDNEKVVEISSNNSDVVTMDERIYPVTDIQFELLDYDVVEGTITITDKSKMVIENVSEEFPLKVLIIGEDGNVDGISIAYYESISSDGEKAVYYFKQDGLKRNTTYTIRVCGPVNTSGLDWEDPQFTDKSAYANYYLGGINFTTKSPSMLSANFEKQKTTSGNNAFEINFSISSAYPSDDAAYEVGNLEKITFALFDSNHNQIGTEVIVSDGKISEENVKYNHKSDFELIYDKDNPKYNTDYVLTDYDFVGVYGDSRIVGGGDFYIQIIDSEDYTSNDTKYPYFTNKMDWDPNSIKYEFKIEMRHTYSDNANGAIKVEQIKNVDAYLEDKEDEEDEDKIDLEDDTIVGLNITPDYSWSDALSIKYYVYKVDVDDREPFISAELYMDNWRYKENGSWTGEYIKPVGTKTFTLSEGSFGKNVTPWEVYFDEKSNIADDNVTKLFERGYSYFVRYEVTCDGTIGGETSYPACLYSSENATPFYRSEVFNVLRQTPVVYRYLWDTTKSNDEYTHQWKYIIHDPDGAIMAESDDPKFYIYQSDEDYETILDELENDASIVKEDGTEISMLGLYDATAKKWNDEYKVISIDDLTLDSYYTVGFDYRLCNYVNKWYGVTTDSTISKLYRVDDIGSVTTEIGSEGDDLSHWNNNEDYQVNGVMVKGVGLEKGTVEEGGYRIKLTIQGDEIDKISALRVTLTDKANPKKKIVYDPVSITVADNKTSGTDESGNDIVNYYANAYLAYAPIIEAEMTETDVYINVIAYCKTGNKGLKSFVDYNKYQDPQEGLLTGESAWAIKGVTYTKGLDYVEKAYFVSVNSDGTKELLGSKNMERTEGNATSWPTMQDSLILPFMEKGADDEYKNKSFNILEDTINVATLDMMFTNESLSINKLSQLMSHQILCKIDETGLSDTLNRYLTVERLELKPLQLDFSKESPFVTGEIKTGSGLPAVAKDDNSTSIGRSSAVLSFNTKGTFPETHADKTLYIELYDVEGANVELKKYYYKDDSDVINYFYATSDYTPASFEYECDESDKKGTAIKYYANGVDGNVKIAIRGLQPSTKEKTQKYHAYVYTYKNNAVQYLFDYDYSEMQRKYFFTTMGDIEIPVGSVYWNTPSYSGKNGQFRFAVSGSEGTNMMIYFKVYDMNGNEIKPGSSNSSYITRGDIGYGYHVAPLGTKIKYYDSDPSTNNPISIDLKPGGVLKLNTEYKIVVTAYEARDGIVDFTSVLGTTEPIVFKTPERFTNPRASVRITQGQNSLTATINMSDENRIIVNDEYMVALYSASGELVEGTEKTVPLEKSTGNTVISKDVIFEGLTENTVYTLKIIAPIDKDNNGVDDDKPYTEEINTSTISHANATVIYEFSQAGKLIFTLRNCTNYDNVKEVMYTIYSEDGTNYCTSKKVPMRDWKEEAGPNGISYSYEVDTWEPFVGETYFYMIQYYDEHGEVLGTTDGYFKKS